MSEPHTLSDAASQAWDATLADQIIAPTPAFGRSGPAHLHALQKAFGCIPDVVLPRLAAALNISRAELHGWFPSMAISAAPPPAAMC